MATCRWEDLPAAARIPLFPPFPPVDWRIVPAWSVSMPRILRLVAPESSATLRAAMNANTILWIYIVLLLAGGVMGLVKGGSQVSLLTSVAFAVPLVLCNLNVLPFAWATGLLVALIVVFAWRLAKTKKFMPAGLLVILTALALALPRIFR
jgi:uncharacterized membrane protein (UPF0136 family)